MARITVEDCLKNVNNRFDLILLAAKRARQLAAGEAMPTVEPNHDKDTVIALREIAAGTFLESDLIKQEIAAQQEKIEFEQQGIIDELF